MSSTINVTVHASQFPERVRDSVWESLRSRRIAPKFHYQSYKQAQLWLALHRSCSPAWLDANVKALYCQSSEAAASLWPDRRVNVVGLGCGGGEKERRLLHVLAQREKEVCFLPCDVSLPLLLTAAGKAGPVPCKPLLCDLALASDLPGVFDSLAGPDVPRLLTFFGMIPNFEPDQILPELAALMRAPDLLLFSANLAPGPDYEEGVQQVLPGYDNARTRGWLRAFLEDLGAKRDDGEIKFSIEEATGLFRIVADFHFARERGLVVYDEPFIFQPGEVVRLFFSYRHTPETIRSLLRKNRVEILQQWVAKSEEEGIFLCRRQG